MHFLHTRQRNTFLNVWSMSTLPHSEHFGFFDESNDIAARGTSVSILRRTGIRWVCHNARGSRVCMALSRSRSRSLARKSSITSFSSSTRKPPLELTIFDKSYSKYFPRRASLRSGRATFGAAVGDVDVAGVTSSGRLLFKLAASLDEEAAACSRSRCLAFAGRPL